MKKELNNRPLSVDEVMQMSDSDFLVAVHNRNNFVLKGGKRCFKYRTTNENVAKFLEHMSVRKNDVVLSVAGSGVSLFEMLSCDKKVPKAIIAFDYSPKQVAYNYLLKTAIRILSYREFICYFGIKGREADRSVIRKQLMRDMPPQIKSSLPRRHHFTKRDLLLNMHNQVSWFMDEKKYNAVRSRLDRIKFCEYEISHKNLSLAKIFCPHSFDVIYLSNVLDWICWHNQDIQDIRPLREIYDDICKIAKKRGKIVLCNLKSRESLVPNFLNGIRITHDVTYQTYKYLWRNITIICQ